MMMANFGQETKPIPVIAKISQETLAEMMAPPIPSALPQSLPRSRYIDYNSVAMLIIVPWSMLCCTIKLHQALAEQPVVHVDSSVQLSPTWYAAFLCKQTGTSFVSVDQLATRPASRDF